MTDTLADILGIVGIREYESAPAWAQAKVEMWAAKLRTRDDDDFMWEAASCIHASALANSFRGNWEAEHAKASACHHEAKRRHLAAGHTKDCRGDTLYSRAFVEAWAGQGYSRSAYPPEPCDCGQGG